jgi:hypothetical protein
MVRYYEPFEYVHLMKHRKVVFGKDMLPRIPPPSKDAFIDFLLHQVPNVITYPQSREFCALLERSDSAVRDIALMLERSLFLKLYWEHGTILPVQQTLHSQCEQQYPEWFASLNTFRETSNEQSVFKLFTLLRNFTNDVHKYLN